MVTHDTFAGFVDLYGEPPASAVVGLRAVRDDELPGLDDPPPLRVVLTGGAAQLSGPVALAGRRGWTLAALDTTLRDLADPAGNARRVVAATADLPDGTALHVRVSGDPTPAWLAALDVLAEAEAVVAVPLAGTDPEPWVDAALDRELACSLVGGTAEEAVGALRTTARLWGDELDLAAARRWCRSWLPDAGGADGADDTDPVAAVEHLAGLEGQ